MRSAGCATKKCIMSCTFTAALLVPLCILRHLQSHKFPNHTIFSGFVICVQWALVLVSSQNNLCMEQSVKLQLCLLCCVVFVLGCETSSCCVVFNLYLTCTLSTLMGTKKTHPTQTHWAYIACYIQFIYSAAASPEYNHSHHSPFTPLAQLNTMVNNTTQNNEQYNTTCQINCSAFNLYGDIVPTACETFYQQIYFVLVCTSLALMGRKTHQYPLMGGVAWPANKYILVSWGYDQSC